MNKKKICIHFQAVIMAIAERIRAFASQALHWIKLENSVRQFAIHRVEKAVVRHQTLARATEAMN